MQQLKTPDYSPYIFTTIILMFFSAMVGALTSSIFGPISPINSFFLGILNYIFFKIFFEGHTEKLYWWIRIWWQLNVKNGK